MDDKQFNELKGKLDLIVRFLALNLIKDMRVQRDQILALSSFGLKPGQIAAILDTTSTR